MNETQLMLRESADRVFSQSGTREVRESSAQGVWPAALWRIVEDTGLTLAATTEARGGPGTTLGDAYSLIKQAGYHALPLPLAETFLAEQALAAAGLPPCAGPLTAGPDVRGDSPELSRHQGKWRLNGTLHRVPWARHAEAVVVVGEYQGKPATAVLRQPAVHIANRNLADEPRDTLVFTDCAVADEDVATGLGFDIGTLRLRGALARAAATAGALERLLSETVAYAQTRVQFGRPIAKFQAIQQQIAIMAGETAAAGAAAQAAVDALEFGAAGFEIAAAKVRVSDAVAPCAAISHQVHGALGFTREHLLHWYTRRAWAWRDEFGDEQEWAEWVGRAIASIGADQLWARISATTGDEA